MALFYCSNVQGDSQTSICITIEPGLLLKGDILVRMAQKHKFIKKEIRWDLTCLDLISTNNLETFLSLCICVKPIIEAVYCITFCGVCFLTLLLGLCTERIMLKQFIVSIHGRNRAIKTWGKSVWTGSCTSFYRPPLAHNMFAGNDDVKMDCTSFPTAPEKQSTDFAWHNQSKVLFFVSHF